MYYKSCRWDTTHATGFHNTWDKAKAEFSQSGGGHSGRGRGGGRGHSAEQGHGDDDQTYTFGRWKGNDAKVSVVLTTNGGIEKHKGKWSMFTNLAGGIPPIQLDVTTHGLLILSPFLFLPLTFSSQIKNSPS